MCGGGGGGDNTAAREQALSARVSQGEQDMISRVNRGLEIRRLLTPEQIAAMKAAKAAENQNPYYRNRQPNNTSSSYYLSDEQMSEDPTYEY